MSNTRTKVVILILLLGLVCFLTAPVFSGEGPWDADGTGGSGNSNDTTGASDEPDIGDLLRGSEDPDDGDGDGLLVFFLKTTYRYFMFQFMDESSFSSAPQVKSKALNQTVVVNEPSSDRVR